MLGVLVCFSLMAIAIRELSNELGTFQILFYRSLIGLLFISPVMFRYGWHLGFTQRPGKHIARNSAHFIGQYAWVYAIAFIPLAEVFALEFTTPAWTVLLAALFLGERLNRYRLIALVCGITGVLLILRPGAELIHPAALVMLVGAWAYALTNVFTKQLASTEKPLTIVFYMLIVQLPLSLVPTLMDWQLPSGIGWFYLVIIALTALAAHFCLARALSLADASVVIPIDFMRLPLIAIVGYVLYNEAIDAWVIIGASLMLAGNLYSIRKEHDYALNKGEAR